MKQLILTMALCVMPLCYAETQVDAQSGATEQTTSNEKPQTTSNDVKQPQTKSNRQTVVLNCDLHCQGCCDKIMKNIAWEKGVKDIVCDLKTKTVTLTYDTKKTDLETLLKAFDRIGKPASLKE
jgi:copper chaperone CopZ